MNIIILIFCYSHLFQVNMCLHSPLISGLLRALGLAIAPRTVCRLSCFADERVEAAECTCFVLGMLLRLKILNKLSKLVPAVIMNKRHDYMKI